jgi:hypothetical protein
MLTRLAQIMLFAHGVQCLVGRQAAIQAAPGFDHLEAQVAAR